MAFYVNQSTRIFKNKDSHYVSHCPIKFLQKMFQFDPWRSDKVDKLPKVFQMTMHCICLFVSQSVCTLKMFLLNFIVEPSLSQSSQDDPVLHLSICISVCLFDSFHSCSGTCSRNVLFPCQIAATFWLVLVCFSPWRYFWKLLHQIAEKSMLDFSRAATRVQETILFPACQLWQLWQQGRAKDYYKICIGVCLSLCENTWLSKICRFADFTMIDSLHNHWVCIIAAKQVWQILNCTIDKDCLI